LQIALITATPASVSLGSGTFVAAENLRRGLAQIGHQVRLLQPGRPLAPRGFALRRLWFNARLDRRSLRAQDLICGFDLDGYRAGGAAGPPYVAWLHGVIADEARFERGTARWSLTLQSLAERLAARRADLVLAPSEYSRGRIAQLYGVPPERIRVVPPGFDVERWEEAGALAKADAGPRRGPTVLCVGRMYPRKNHAALLRAVSRLGDAVPGLAVRIVGDGPERQRLEGLARRLALGDTVRFTGQVGFEQLAREYAAADVFCLPTLQEGYGLAFAEAMTAGVPVVACRAGAVPELIGPEYGLLVEPGDIGALAAALAGLLRDPDRRRLMGGAARAEALRRFGLARAARAFMAAVGPLTACQDSPPAQ
jgi:glycosyltransferase involved in cell wall biosynthesis